MGRMTIEDLALIVAQGFSEMGEQVKILREEIHTLKDRVGRVEYAVHNIQQDLVTLDREMRGIHKVIDYLDQRVSALENRQGMMPLL